MYLPYRQIAAFPGLFAPIDAHAQQGTSPVYGPHMWYDGWHGWMFGPIAMVFVIAAAAIVIALLVRWLGGLGHGKPPAGETPLDILEKRFARGEIDKADFEERRRVIGA